jgi:phenolic acid decarboxylase
MKPWFLIVAFWGLEHRAYFANMCLASLMAPGNLEVLKDRPGSTFLIATTKPDWDALTTHPLFIQASHYVQMQWLEIDQVDTNKFRTMSDAHAVMGHLAFQARAIGTWLAPDMVISHGAIEFARKKIDEEGKAAVRVCALRHDFRGLMSELRDKGIFLESQALDVSQRDLAGAAVRHMHSETQAYEYEQPYFGCPMPVAPWWRVAPDGAVVHTLSWLEFALDYSRVPAHDLNTFHTWTVDGDYLWRQLHHVPLEDIYAVYDSDEIVLVGTTREEQLHYPKMLLPPCSLPVYGKRFKRMYVRYVRNNMGVIDPIKHRLFRKGVFLHGSDLTPKWRAVAKRAEQEMALTTQALTPIEVKGFKEEVDAINAWAGQVPGPIARGVQAAEYALKRWLG